MYLGYLTLKDIRERSLQNDLKQYINNSKFSDVKFRCEDDSIIFAHKVSYSLTIKKKTTINHTLKRRRRRRRERGRNINR
jgi:hypothetical protein